MNKYSTNFNDIDPETGRPFSAGHPDGVWIISIVYSLIVFVSAGVALFGIYKIITGSDAGYAMFLAGATNTLIFSLPVYFLFRRSANAVYIIGFIAFLAVSAGIVSLFTGVSNKFVLSGIACLQIYIFIYVIGLKKDGLLSRK
jgi:hypothetical protein